MSKKLTTLLSLAAVGAIVTAGVLVKPMATHALSNKNKVDRTYNAALNFHNTFSKESDDLTILQSAFTADPAEATIEQAYTTINDSIDELQGTAIRAKNKANHLVYARRSEKETLRSAMSLVIVDVEVIRNNVNAAYTQFQQDGDSTVATTTMESELSTLLTYINDHKDEYGSRVRTYFLLMLDANMENTQDGLTSIASIKDAYDDLGVSTTTLTSRYASAQTAYEEAQSWYNKAGNEADINLKSYYYGKALWRLIASRAWLTSAQHVVNSLESAQLNG